MNTVHIFIPDTIFFVPRRRSSPGTLYGWAICHTADNEDANNQQQCTFHVIQCCPSSALGDGTANRRLSAIGQIEDKEKPAEQTVIRNYCGEFFATFSYPTVKETLEQHEKHQSPRRLVLESLQVPGGLTQRTHIEIVTYNRRLPPALPLAALCHVRKNYDDEHHNADANSRCGRDSNAMFTFIRTNSERCVRSLKCVGTTFPVLQHTAVFQHLLSRFGLLSRPSASTLCSLATDTALGVLLTMLLLRIGHPYLQFTHYTEVIVINVRHLLDALKGFPIGLKLNIELNNFLLGIFTYHIDLWVTFLVLIAPMLHGLFVPFVSLGAVGLSLQLAIVSDLLVFISLHAHCFYIYVAVLYHNELAGIVALWRVLRGLRHNTLKARVESHDYTNQQLYLATMFFASLLFLLPTVLLYYVVFAFLRFCVYCITYVLISIQRRVLALPAYCIGLRVLNYLRGNHGPRLHRVCNVPSALPNPVHLTTTVFRTKDLTGDSDHHINEEDVYETVTQLPDMLSIGQFFMGLVRGQTMGFILPLSKQ